MRFPLLGITKVPEFSSFISWGSSKGSNSWPFFVHLNLHKERHYWNAKSFSQVQTRAPKHNMLETICYQNIVIIEIQHNKLPHLCLLPADVTQGSALTVARDSLWLHTSWGSSHRKGRRWESWAPEMWWWAAAQLGNKQTRIKVWKSQHITELTRWYDAKTMVHWMIQMFEFYSKTKQTTTLFFTVDGFRSIQVNNSARLLAFWYKTLIVS